MALDTAKLKERFEKKSGRGDRFELKDGDNMVRILPPSIEYLAETVDYISYEYLMHYQLGIEGNKTAEVCPKTADRKQRCPICEAVAKLYRLNTPEDKALASQIRAKKRYLFNIIDLNDKEKGIQILEVGPKIYEALVVFITNSKWGDLLDLDKGRDVCITKVNSNESQSRFTEYSVAPDPSVTSAREYLPKNFKEGFNGLKKAIPQAKSYDELKVVLEGGDSAVDVGAVKASSSVETKEEDVPGSDASEPAPAKVIQHKVVQAPETLQETPVPPKGKEPTCYGQQYGPRRTECVPCAVKITCREKFLEM